MIFDLPPPTLTSEIVIATGEVSKGSDKSGGRGFLMGRTQAAFGPLLLGVQAQTVNLGDGADAELHAWTGLGGEVAGFELAALARYERFPGTLPGRDNHEWEYEARASREFGRFEAALEVQYSPNPYGSATRSLWAEAEGTVRVTDRLWAVATVGRRERDGDTDYTAWSVGARYRLRQGLELEARWYDNSAGEPGDRARDMTVLRLRASR